jgi:Tfp pilus assembly pilus retraction ATPase PilT
MDHSQFDFLSGGEAASTSRSGIDSSHRSANGTLEKLQIPLYQRMGRENDVVIMVTGISGSGKSSFIARCCDQDVNIQHGLVSCEDNELN